MNTNDVEKVFIEALDLHEKGKSIQEILSLFPKYKRELKEFFGIIEVLSFQKDKIKHSKEILMEIISKIPSSRNVTDPKINRYFDMELRINFFRKKIMRGKKGRPSFFQFGRLAKLNFMRKQAVILAGLLVVAIVVLAGIYLQPQEPEGTGSLSPGVKQEELAEGNKDSTSTAPSTDAIVDVSSLVDIEDELGAELNGVDSEISDMTDFEADTSLDNLDTSLSGILE